MIIKIRNTELIIEEKETNLYGLKFLPQFSNFDNDADNGPFTQNCSTEVSDRSFQLISEITKNYMTDGIIEIGVSRNGDRSFTNVILKNKADDIKYCGIDLEDKSYLNDSSKNIFTIKENSFNQKNIRDFLKEIGISQISILFIDGWHSLNACINDWQFTDLLSDKSIVIFHDTNFHPGPRAFIEAVDEKIFTVKRYFIDEDDYGVTIAYKKTL